MQRPALLAGMALAVLLTAALSACGSAAGGGMTSASGSASGSSVAAAEQPCTPVGEELQAQADTTIDVVLTDYALEPSEVTADAGTITFATTNAGAEAHELAFLPGGGEVPVTGEGLPDEEALAEMGAFELEAYGPGQSCGATYDLAPGTYTLFCIVEAPDGQTHYEKGMGGTLTVE